MSRTSRRKPLLGGVGIAQDAAVEGLAEDMRRQGRDVQRAAGRFAVQWVKAVDGGAAANLADAVLFANPDGFDRQVELVTFTGAGTVVAHASNYARLVLERRRGAETAYVGELKSTSTWPEWRPVPFALNGKGGRLGPGDVLVVRLEKAGSGVVVPAGVVTAWVVDG